MSEFRTLLSEFWIRKDADKDLYYRVKRDIPQFQRFLREQMGWKLIHTEKLLKLEKIPAHAEAFMGIRDFTEIRDYCVLCACLMYLEDLGEGEQFLLSELIDYVETELKGVMEVDWTSFSQRKSLVRVLQYMERLGMLKVYEGSSEAFGQEAGREVLYENTGYSKYFATALPEDPARIRSFRELEELRVEAAKETAESSRAERVRRVYRQMAVCPAMYWTETSDPDALYLKNQRGWVARNLSAQMGGRLDVHRNAAFLMMEEGDACGIMHPRDAMLPEAVLLLCGRLRDMVSEGSLAVNVDDSVVLSGEALRGIILDLREEWREAWSKEFREMEGRKLTEQLIRYMKDWMMLREDGEQVVILPAAAKLSGYYPPDYQEPDRGDET